MANKHTPGAEKLADAVLKASGSGLRHYSMVKIREAIFRAAQEGIDKAQKDLLEAARRGRLACQLLANECINQDDSEDAEIWQKEADLCEKVIKEAGGR